MPKRDAECNCWHGGRSVRRDQRLGPRSPPADWQHVHIAIDDHSRLAYAAVRPPDRQADALAFLDRALTWFRTQGITVQAVMTDYGSAYRSHAWRQRCVAPALRHLRTRPSTPRTHGTPERFIHILRRRWAYAFAYPSTAHERSAAGSGGLTVGAPHGSLGGRPPVSRVSHLCGQYN